MTKTDDGGLAFPGVRYEEVRLQAGTPVFGDVSYPGMTLRDWFAGQIAGGMAAFSGTAGVSYGPNNIAGRAYQVADAMLAARGGSDA